ncbi:DUF3667 domain-containing protein [Flaviramulus aquimarinus]
MKNNLETCKNCEQQFEDGFKFCPHCGQQAKDELTVKVLFYNTISNYFSFDARFFKSFIPLLFKPGYLASKFIEGKRLLYLHPAQLYLFISVVFFFLFSFIARQSVEDFDTALQKGFESDNVVKSIDPKLIDSVALTELSKTLKDSTIIKSLNKNNLKALDSIITNATIERDSVNTFEFDYDKTKVDSLIKINAPEAEKLRAMGMEDDAGFFKRRFYSKMLKFQEHSGKGILQAFYDNIPISLFVLLPIFALILKILFFRRGAFAHHLVFSFYFYSFLFTVFSIILLANLIWKIPDFISILIALSTFFYLFLAIKNFYKQGYFISFFKTCLVSFIYLTFVVPIAVIMMAVGSFLFY